MSAIPDLHSTSGNRPTSTEQLHDPAIDSKPMSQFWLTLMIYASWSLLAWLCHFAGITSIASQAVPILLIGIGATNALFYIIARSDALHRPAAETITLAQSVVAIAWATLFAFMSSGSDTLVSGIYLSIVLFAILRVRLNVLHQIVIFAVISYTTASVVKVFSTGHADISAAELADTIVFAGIMLCVSLASRHIYRQYQHVENRVTHHQTKSRHSHGGTSSNSVSRRYIIELLTREKGYTDRSNVPFCICIFNADYTDTSPTALNRDTRALAMQAIEVIIRNELRDMDSLNTTGFHDCFGPYSDKEYIAILPQTNIAGAQTSMDRALDAQRNSADNAIRLSGGLAEYRRGESISDFLARAEEALHEACGANISGVCSSQTPAVFQADIVRLEPRRS